MIIDTNTAIAQDVTLVVKWPPIMSHYFWQLCQTFLIAGRSGGQRLSRFFDRGTLRTKGLFVDTPAHCNLYMDKSNQIGSPMISLLDGDEWPSWDRGQRPATWTHSYPWQSRASETPRRPPTNSLLPGVRSQKAGRLLAGKWVAHLLIASPACAQAATSYHLT